MIQLIYQISKKTSKSPANVLNSTHLQRMHELHNSNHLQQNPSAQQTQQFSRACLLMFCGELCGISLCHCTVFECALSCCKILLSFWCIVEFCNIVWNSDILQHNVECCRERLNIAELCQILITLLISLRNCAELRGFFSSFVGS